MKPATSSAFLNELEKIARVPKAVKMYRRALQMLESGKFDIHGVRKPEAMLSILKDKAIKGTHGRRELEDLFGVYFQKGTPARGFYGNPSNANLGVAVPSSKNVARGAVTEKVNPKWNFVETTPSSEGLGELALGKGDVLIAPKHGPGGSRFFDAIEEVQRGKGVRHIEPSIFNIAAQPKMLAKTHEPVKKVFTKKDFIDTLKKGRESYAIRQKS